MESVTSASARLRGLDRAALAVTAGVVVALSLPPWGFWPLAFVFGLFVLFLYGPVITIFVLSFQGPEGGLTFPMRGWSTHWYAELWKGLGVVDIGAALRRSLALGVVVMLLTVLLYAVFVAMSFVGWRAWARLAVAR